MRPAATDTGPPPESSGFYLRQVVQAAKDHGFIGLSEALAAASNGHGDGHPHGPEDRP